MLLLHLVDDLSVSTTWRQDFRRLPINLLLRNDCAASRFMSEPPMVKQGPEQGSLTDCESEDEVEISGSIS